MDLVALHWKNRLQLFHTVLHCNK